MLDLEKYQAQLTISLNTLIAELTTIAVYDEESDNWEAIPDAAELQETDLNTEADAVEAWNERRATVAALETEYRDTKRALHKITLGTFGICEISGNPIEEKRLEAKAIARTCIAHMEEESQLSL